MLGGRHSFAVVDCETTGLFPGAHHRIIELAVVQLSPSGERQAEWHTLVNPERDLGDAGIHGIHGRDVIEAPTFRDLAGTVLELLGGRIVVAHNARFDQSFVEAELARAGYDVSPLSCVCTIALSRRAGLRAARLSDCCGEVGIASAGAHAALSDARECAQLFQALCTSHLPHADLSQLGCGEPRPDWPAAPAAAPPRPRSSAPPVREQSFLSRLADKRSAIAGAQSADADAYLELLDHALEDRRLDDSERDDLEGAAGLYDLSGAQLADLHASYFDGMCRTALADGVITDRERYDLGLLAELLGISNVDERLRQLSAEADGALAPTAAAEPSSELAGKTICFTGKLLCSVGGEPLTRERAHELAAAAGLVPAERVTKALDILIVADPDSLSGKARKARDYGTRIIAEASFWPMIGVQVS